MKRRITRRGVLTLKPFEAMTLPNASSSEEIFEPKYYSASELA